ncbi:hypothetical protein H4R26_002796, partial [Coemansia thaxteri]
MLSSINSTPAAQHRTAAMLSMAEAKLEERRTAIYSALVDHGKSMDFYMLMDMLG